MELEFAFFARYVEALGDGTFAVQGGGLNRLSFSAFPVMVPVLALLARFKPSPEEAPREHLLQLDVTGPEGKRTSLPGPHQTAALAPSAVTAVEGSRVHCAVTLLGYTYQTPGEYTFHIIVDGKELGTVTLRLVETSPAGGGA
jgi:hypothetical protein